MKGVLVTGGSGGIGSALVRKLIRLGFETNFTFCTQSVKAKELAQQTGARAVLYDATNAASVQELCRGVAEGSLIGLVNLAAAPMHRGPFLKLDCDVLLDHLHRDLTGTMKLSQAFARRCKEQKEPGAIVNVLSSVVLGFPPENVIGYVMSKYALLGATRALAAEFSKYGIRVNSISPAMTRTNYISDLPERLVEMLEENLPFKRIATPEEVAETIAFLLSQGSTYIHGANIPVTGGAAC